ncbi:MAG: helix-turn-helix transcriptional regulator [Steroidobacter sp.]|nr:helix-turn-helix transcriptional regulator [Steroidobacter sp.]
MLAEVDGDASLHEQTKQARQWVSESFYDAPTLSSLRLKAGLSQKDLGTQCDLRQEHISRYESGRTEPGLSVANKLATALGVSLDEFAHAWNNTRARADSMVNSTIK